MQEGIGEPSWAPETMKTAELGLTEGSPSSRCHLSLAVSFPTTTQLPLSGPRMIIRELRTPEDGGPKDHPLAPPLPCLLRLRVPNP